MRPFVLKAHGHHHVAGNESRKKKKWRLLWLSVHFVRNYQHLQKNADVKQILKQDPCFYPWGSSGPSKTKYPAHFPIQTLQGCLSVKGQEKGKQPLCFLVHFRKMGPAVLEWSLFPYLLAVRRLKCSTVMEHYNDLPQGDQLTGNLSWNYRTATETWKGSKQKVHDIRNFRYQPVLWPLPGQVSSSQKDEVSGGGVLVKCAYKHRGEAGALGLFPMNIVHETPLSTLWSVEKETVQQHRQTSCHGSKANPSCGETYLIRIKSE